jgi:hypothetical protein
VTVGTGAIAYKLTFTSDVKDFADPQTSHFIPADDGPATEEFDLVICIVWSRLGPLLDRAIGGVLEALEEQARAHRPFVLVLGASGSGKSSLVPSDF